MTALYLPARLNPQVTSLTRTDDGFEVRTADDTSLRTAARGGHRAVPGALCSADRQGLEPSVTQVHSASYSNPEAVSGRSVLVVGGGNSEKLSMGQVGTHVVGPRRRTLGANRDQGLKSIGPARCHSCRHGPKVY